MAKRDIERDLENLNSVDDPEILRKALRDKVNLVVARAATRIGKLGDKSSLPDLLISYERQFVNGAKVDPQCWAKNAIAKALKDLEWNESKPFILGAQYHQWEPVWGSEADSAGPLRATCLLAIPFCTDLLRYDKLWHLMRGFSDRLAAVRLETARALEQMGGIEPAFLLRLKARSGDRDPTVTGQVFESLLNVEGEQAVAFVVEFVTQRGETNRDEETAEQAALTLGASPFENAITALVECAGNARLTTMKDVVLRALGLSRLEAAASYLLQVVADGRERDAAAALQALEPRRRSEDIASRVAQAIRQRDSAALTAQWQRLFLPS